MGGCDSQPLTPTSSIWKVLIHPSRTVGTCRDINEERDLVWNVTPCVSGSTLWIYVTLINLSSPHTPVRRHESMVYVLHLLQTLLLVPVSLLVFSDWIRLYTTTDQLVPQASTLYLSFGWFKNILDIRLLRSSTLGFRLHSVFLSLCVWELIKGLNSAKWLGLGKLTSPPTGENSFLWPCDGFSM